MRLQLCDAHHQWLRGEPCQEACVKYGRLSLYKARTQGKGTLEEACVASEMTAKLTCIHLRVHAWHCETTRWQVVCVSRA